MDPRSLRFRAVGEGKVGVVGVLGAGVKKVVGEGERK